VLAGECALFYYYFSAYSRTFDAHCYKIIVNVKTMISMMRDKCAKCGLAANNHPSNTFIYLLIQTFIFLTC